MAIGTGETARDFNLQGGLERRYGIRQAPGGGEDEPLE